ncbi:hypothetical protein [Frisingicoccus sp.]|uniref:hypothetical protein n=1 Tax=Frisingicoccus sp. TaxID=1918627 RepID=UPI003AB282DC
MADTKYILRYLPLFYEELEEKVVYIAEKLMNPQAANDLLDMVETQYWNGCRVQKPLNPIIH